MKLIKTVSLVALLGVFAVSCKSPAGDKATATDAMETSGIENYDAYQASLDESTVAWIGTKPTGQHNGTVKLSDGELKINDGQIVGGSFKFDLNSIVVLDIKDAEMNGKLLGHLISADFLEVETYPTAEFEIVKVEAKQGVAQAETGVAPTHTISGNLTMKGITRAISFDARVDISAEKISAQSVRFLIDRTNWGVNYGSNKIFDNLKDNFIHDDIALTINLLAVK